MAKKKVWLAQQAVWDIDSTGLESMPLACGYLKAAALADEDVRREMDVRIFNLGGATDTLTAINKMFFDDIPDVLALSIFGWNYAMFGRVAQTFRQLNPDGWVVLGGTHVAHQAERVFREYPAVDVVANGEGERTFRNLLRAHLAGSSRHELNDVRGITFKTPDGERVTTPDEDRIVDLDEIPSPFLSGAMDLLLPNGSFRYDVALMETNRGCPYKCSFCYWGGAIGQKVRAFSTDRLREEIELFGRHKVANICLCDANFGMLREDEEFVEILIKTRERYGYPKSVITSWAKNKGKRFYGIVNRMKSKGFHSSFTLALQTLSDEPLEKMGRKNMKVNAWEDLADWLYKEGLDVYGELIWGCPGETCESFLEGYDRLASVVSRVAVYPHLLMPNTDYSKDKEKYGFVTWRSGRDDFEYVLAHETMTMAENRWMHRFLYWARVAGEYQLFRYVWPALNKLAGVTHSQLFLNLDRWVDRETHPAAAGLRACRSIVEDRLNAYEIERGLHYFYLEDGLDEIMPRWWEDDVLPLVPDELRDFFRELFRYDWLTKPRYVADDGVQAQARRSPSIGEHEIEEFDGDEYYVSEVEMRYDIPACIELIRKDRFSLPQPKPRMVRLYHKKGFSGYISNHEFYHHYVGKTMDQLVAERAAAREVDRDITPIPVSADEDPDAPKLVPIGKSNG